MPLVRRQTSGGKKGGLQFTVDLSLVNDAVVLVAALFALLGQPCVIQSLPRELLPTPGTGAGGGRPVLCISSQSPSDKLQSLHMEEVTQE